MLTLGEDRRTEGNAGKGSKRKDNRWMSRHTGKQGKKNGRQGKYEMRIKEDKGRTTHEFITSIRAPDPILYRVCVHICIFVYIYMYISIYIYTCISIYIYIYNKHSICLMFTAGKRTFC